MNQEEANAKAAAIMAQEHKKAVPLVKAGVAAATIAARLRTGLVTLMGAYAGWRLAKEFPGSGIPPGVAGIFLGLVAAVLFPASKT